MKQIATSEPDLNDTPAVEGVEHRLSQLSPFGPIVVVRLGSRPRMSPCGAYDLVSDAITHRKHLSLIME